MNIQVDSIKPNMSDLLYFEILYLVCILLGNLS